MSVAAGVVTRCHFPVVGSQGVIFLLQGHSLRACCSWDPVLAFFPFSAQLWVNVSISESLLLQSEFAYLLVSWIPGTASFQASLNPSGWGKGQGELGEALGALGTSSGGIRRPGLLVLSTAGPGVTVG